MPADEADYPKDDRARERLDEDDHDLLTFTETAERLRVEIAALTARVAELSAGREQGVAEELSRSKARLAALQSAARRNSVQQINDANFERFFGYAGKARRNVPGPDSPNDRGTGC